MAVDTFCENCGAWLCDSEYGVSGDLNCNNCGAVTRYEIFPTRMTNVEPPLQRTAPPCSHSGKSTKRPACPKPQA